MKKKNNKGSQKSKTVFQLPTKRSVKLKFKAERMARKMKNLDLKVDQSTSRKTKTKKDKKLLAEKKLKELCQEVVITALKKNSNAEKVKKRENTKLMKGSKSIETNGMTALVKQMQI
ncbi:hypothetical protein M0802_010155 [Mischocyttarus mexicanus]|nr:hypothetical protein M0802_010155 [Mischocyttarus mexicanus]